MTAFFFDQVKIMFGANKHEGNSCNCRGRWLTLNHNDRLLGIYVADVILDDFLRPNHLENDAEFLRYGLIPTLLNAISMMKSDPTLFRYEKLKREKISNFKMAEVPDESRSLSDALYLKYFSYALEEGQTGNLSYLMPGIVDVCLLILSQISIRHCNTKLLFTQLGGALFLKAGGWETVRLHSRHHPGAAFWYSFDYRGRHQLLGADPLVPPGFSFECFIVDFILETQMWYVWIGVGHADEIQYLWTVPFPKNTSENNMCLRIRETWINFIVHGYILK